MKGTSYALADVSFATRTVELAAVSIAAAGFMAAPSASAIPLALAADEAASATLQTFEGSAPEVQVSLPEDGKTSFVTPLEDQALPHQEAEISDHSDMDTSDQEAQEGLADVQQQDLAPEPLAASDEGPVQLGTPEFSFGGGDSALMQALLLVTQAGQTGEPKGADLPAVTEAIAESADQEAVDTLIDHFAGHDGAQISAGTDTALDQALGTILAGAGADGLYVAMGDGFEMAAMVAAVEAQSAAA